MRLRMLTTMAGPKGNALAGSHVYLDEADAESLVKAGAALRDDEPASPMPAPQVNHAEFAARVSGLEARVAELEASLANFIRNGDEALAEMDKRLAAMESLAKKPARASGKKEEAAATTPTASAT